MGTDSKSNNVKVTVVGPGFGEAIIITVGSSLMIGIDSCLGLVQLDNNESTVLQRAIDERISKDAPIFWVLTHLHCDHFESFSSVLNLVGNRMCEIITPFSYTEKTVWNDVIANDAAESRPFARRISSKAATDEYHRILKILESDEMDDKCKHFAGEYPLPVRNGSTRAQPDLNVTILGPSAKQIRNLVGKAVGGIVAKCDQKRLTNVANEGSYFVHLTFGQFEGLFLADAKSKRVENWLERKRGLTDAQSFFLKVAHHGSKDGTSQRLLDLFCGPNAKTNGKTAVVAPFISNRLPTQAILNLLVKSGYDVVQTATQLRKYDENRILAEMIGLVDDVVFDGAESSSSQAVDFEYLTNDLLI